MNIVFKCEEGGYLYSRPGQFEVGVGSMGEMVGFHGEYEITPDYYSLPFEALKDTARRVLNAPASGNARTLEGITISGNQFTECSLAEVPRPGHKFGPLGGCLVCLAAWVVIMCACFVCKWVWGFCFLAGLLWIGWSWGKDADEVIDRS